MTDDKVAAALRECEEALHDLQRRTEDGTRYHETKVEAVERAIARYGDLREKAGYERGRMDEIGDWELRHEALDRGER